MNLDWGCYLCGLTLGSLNTRLNLLPKMRRRRASKTLWGTKWKWPVRGIRILKKILEDQKTSTSTTTVIILTKLRYYIFSSSLNKIKKEKLKFSHLSVGLIAQLLGRTVFIEPIMKWICWIAYIYFNVIHASRWWILETLFRLQRQHFFSLIRICPWCSWIELTHD